MVDDSWSLYGAVRSYSEVLYNLWGPRESDLSDSGHEEIHFSLKSVLMVDVRCELMTVSYTHLTLPTIYSV